MCFSSAPTITILVPSTNRSPLGRIDVGILRLERGDESERRRHAVAGVVRFVELGVGLVHREVLLVDADHEQVADPRRDRILEQAGRALGVQAAVLRRRTLAELTRIEVAMLRLVRRDVRHASGSADEDQDDALHGVPLTTTVPGATSVPRSVVFVCASRTVASSPTRATSSSVPVPRMRTEPRRISTVTCVPRGSGGGSATLDGSSTPSAAIGRVTLAPSTAVPSGAAPSIARVSIRTSSAVMTEPTASACSATATSTSAPIVTGT